MEPSTQNNTAFAPAPVLRIRTSRVRAGFGLACLCGVLGLATISFAPSDPLVAVVTLFLIPLVIGLLLTGRLVDAFTLVWVNEMFFGGSGHWLEVGPVSVRWLLLLALVAFGGALAWRASSRTVRLGQRRPMFSRAIVFYGAFLPIWLVLYSVGAAGTPFWSAVGDVNYLLALLAYFALRRLVLRHFDLVRGWITGGVFTLGLYFFGMSLGPREYVGPIFTNISGMTVMGTTPSGINRAAMVFQILLLVGVFLGSLYAIDGNQSRRGRLAGAVLAGLSLSSYVLMFLRGPLLSIPLIMGLFILAAVRHGKLPAIGARLFILLALIGIGAFAVYSIAVPEGLDRFALGEGGFTSFVNPVRIEQADEMMAALAASPVFGQGVGVPIEGYARSENELRFELQYHMVLYRVGLIAFALLLVPIVWFFLDLFRIVGADRTLVHRADGKFMLAVLLSLLAVSVVGAVNPYLTAIFTPFLVVLYLACRELVLPVTARRGHSL